MFLESVMEVEPVRIAAYCLGDVEIKMFRVDEFTYIVTRIDWRTREGKSLLCFSYEHADYVMDGCIGQLREWIN
jgi:hypothetical protein